METTFILGLSGMRQQQLDRWYARLMKRFEKDGYFFSDRPGKALWDRIHMTDKGYNARLRWLVRQQLEISEGVKSKASNCNREWHTLPEPARSRQNCYVTTAGSDKCADGLCLWNIDRGGRNEH